MSLVVLLLFFGLLAWWAFGGLRLPGVGRGEPPAGRAPDAKPRADAARDGAARDGAARDGAGRDGAGRDGAAREGAALADLRAARAAGAREGFQSGLKQGRAEGYAEAMRQAQAPGRPRAPAAAAPPARPRTRAEALRVLDLPDAATIDQVEERYRQLRRAAHPDNFPRTKYPRAFTELAESEFKRLGEARDLLVR